MKELVSVLVITYNAANFIEETLESIKNQTYKNIELVISDDCSTDNTLQIVNYWIEVNKKSFFKIKLIKNLKNQGICKNLNQGLKSVSGKYLKILAGDDLLEKNCLEKNLSACLKNPNINFLFSKYKSFEVDKKNEKIFLKKEDEKFYKENRRFYDYSSERQYKILKQRDFVFTITEFIKTEKLKECGGFDTRINFIEDFPLWLKISKNREKIYFLDEFTVLYRKHSTSISSSTKAIFNEKMLAMYHLIYKYYLENECSILEKIHYKINFFIKESVIKNGNKNYPLYLKVLKCFDIIGIKNYLIRKNNFIREKREWDINE